MQSTKIMTNYNVIIIKNKVRTTDVTPMTCSFCEQQIYACPFIQKMQKIMSHRHSEKVMYTKSKITNTQLKIITYCNYVTYYDMYVSLT